MLTLTYVVENSQIATKHRSVDVDGQEATLHIRRLSVELVAQGHDGGTIALDLAPDTEGFDEGTVVSVSFGVTE